MRIVEGTVLTTLTRARTFIDSHREQLGQLESAGYRQKLDDVIAGMERYAVDQESARRIGAGQLARQRSLRAGLRLTHMRPIATIAAARLRETPELNELRMPSRKTLPRQLVIAAEAMATMARPYAPVFIASGLAPDFAEQLEAAAQALAECMTDRDTTATVRAGATAGLRTEASRARHVLRVLSALIEPRLADDPAMLVGWRAARHIRQLATRQPAVFPLMGLALARGTGIVAPPANTEAPSGAPAPTTVPLALPAAPAAAPIITASSSPVRSVFSRAIQIIAGRNDEDATVT
jgi:hypothetical protein